MESRPLTTMAVFLAIVFVIAAAYAAMGYFGAEDADTADSSGDQLDSSQEIRSVPVEWDTVTKELTIGTGSDAYTRIVTEYVVAVDGDDVCVMYGDSGTLEWMTVGEFMAGVRVPSLEGLTAVGKETIGTDYGNVNCTVMRGGSGDSTIWVDSHGVVYRSTYTEGGVPVRAELQETTLFQIDPLDEGGALNSEPLGAGSVLQYYNQSVDLDNRMVVRGWVNGMYMFDDVRSYGVIGHPSYKELIMEDLGQNYKVSAGSITLPEFGEVRTVTIISETSSVESATYIIDLGYFPIQCQYRDPEVLDLSISVLDRIWVSDEKYGSHLPAQVTLYDAIGREATITPIGTSDDGYYIWKAEFDGYSVCFRADMELRIENKSGNKEVSIDCNDRMSIRYSNGLFDGLEFMGTTFSQYDGEPSFNAFMPGSTLTYEVDSGHGPMDVTVSVVGWYDNIYYVERQGSPMVLRWISEQTFTDLCASGLPEYTDIMLDVPGVGLAQAVCVTYDDGNISFEAVFLDGLGDMPYSYEIRDSMGEFECAVLTSCDPVFGTYPASDHDSVTYSQENLRIFLSVICPTSNNGYVYHIQYAFDFGLEDAYFIGNYNAVPLDMGSDQTQYVLYGYGVTLHVSENQVIAIEVGGEMFYRK